MGWYGKSTYDCPECGGSCRWACPECGVEEDCPHCDGTGWDPRQVDIEAFKAAEAALQKSSGLTWEWIDNEKRRLGRDGGKFGKIAVKDFLKESNVRGNR